MEIILWKSSVLVNLHTDLIMYVFLIMARKSDPITVYVHK